MRLNRLAAAAAVVVLSTGLLAACGDEDTTGSSTSSGSGDAAPAADLTQDTFADAIGDAMTEAGSAHVELTSTGSLPITAEGDQEIGDTPADSKMDLTMSLAGQEIELRLVDQKVFFKMPAFTQDKFAVIDLTDTSNPLVAQFGGLTEQVDIGEQIKGFGDAITGFEKKGAAQKLDGVEAQPYVVTVDAAKAAESQGQEPVAGMPESIDYTFFLGPDDLVRRVSLDVAGQAVQMDFTKWGEDVSIDAPADDEITDVDLNELMGGLAGATS